MVYCMISYLSFLGGYTWIFVDLLHKLSLPVVYVVTMYVGLEAWICCRKGDIPAAREFKLKHFPVVSLFDTRLKSGGTLFTRLSTPSARGWPTELASGGLTKLSYVRLETVILGFPKDRLMLLNPPAVGLPAPEPLLMPHPCRIPNTLLTPVTELFNVCMHFKTKVTKHQLLLTHSCYTV